MHPKLQSLTIKNFRSIRGEAVIPLDAQVVLIHGSNGMGKTSILSALELGLTGRIAHLADDGDSYQKYLTNFGSNGGSIGLKLSSPLPDHTKDYGSVEFTDSSFSSKPLLTAKHSRFFSERCFLPQSALGRLLEIYDDQTTSTNSPLTLFVKELLGLDPLDSLVDGLYPALHLTRLKNLAPEFRRIEDLKSSLLKQLAEVKKNKSTRQKEQEVAGENLQVDLALLDPNWRAKITVKEGREEIRVGLEKSLGDNTELQRTHRLRSELSSAVENLRTLPHLGDTEMISRLERQAAQASKAFNEWSNIFGRDLDGIIEQMRSTFQELIFSDQGPERARSQAAERASSEVLRCDNLIQKSINAETEQIRFADSTRQCNMLVGP
jgi:exonuclease SbcC